MSRIVYIHANAEGIPFASTSYAAWDGFTKLGYDVRLYQSAELESLALAREVIVVGGIGLVHKALVKVGAPLPAVLDIPEALRSFAGRRIWETTLELARKPESWPVFVKPLHEAKLFVGHVIRDWPDLIVAAGCDSDLPVLAQEPVNFVSEWRVYVRYGQILGLGHYKDNPLSFPDPAVIRAAIGAWGDAAPAGYGIDFGITDDGKTLLVEVNDGHSLGNYNLRPVEYAKLLQARWDEMANAVASGPESP
jgi:ATP-grasp domain, R2K clade family 2